MWLHLFISCAALLTFADSDIITLLSSMVIGSFSLGIIVYGILTRAYGLFINALSYASSMSQVFSSGSVSTAFLVVAIITTLVSAYFLLSREYQHYNREIDNDNGSLVPLWMTVVMGTVVVLLFIFGLNILN
jgi:uncharacterized membrane protein YidH (DUF202 family)|tara:strand:- start:831 stop:1226 length:396 start_codon:yes stop_codon:yes gene_type:complete